MFCGGVQICEGGPNPLVDMDRGGPNPLAVTAAQSNVIIMLKPKEIPTT